MANYTNLFRAISGLDEDIPLDFVLQPLSVQVTRGSLRSRGDLCRC